MTTGYRRCGGYVLLRELAQDALGSTFRAGQVGDDAVADLVLLRLLTVGDAPTVAVAARQRRALGAEVRSPFLGELRDAGRADDGAFLAYEYRPGITGAQLLALAAERMSPLAPELATLVADRAAQAVLAIWNAGGGPSLLLPELLWVSTEGEVRLLGAEAAPALRDAAAAAAPLTPYLSPEARAGEPPAEADDVWSLGALLAALLTGQAPPDVPDSDGAWLAGATLADDGGPLPEPLAELLGRSLVQRAQRLSRVEAWHKALARAVEMLAWRPSPFQLAVYMHALCKPEMAREPRDVERERAEALRPATAAPGVAAAAAAAGAGPTGPPPAATALPSWAAEAEEPPAGRRRSASPLVAAAAVAALVLGAGGWWLLRGRDAAPPPAAPAATAAAAAATVAPPVTASTAALPTAEELEQRLAALMAEREKSLNERYTQEIEQLRSQIRETRSQPAPPPAPPTEARREEPPRPEPPPLRAAEPAAATPAAPSAAAPPPAAPAPAAVPAATAPPQAVLEATLVPARLLQFEPPPYPLVARRQRVEGTVVLSLRVDADGTVGDVRFLRKVAQDVGINEAAAEAARRARFAPATRAGAAVASWYTLTIPFQL